MDDYLIYNKPPAKPELHGDYLFAYSQFDGFNARLLHAVFLVDWDFKYTLKLEAFRHKNLTQNGSDSLVLTEQLTGEKLERLERFLSLDLSQLKTNYRVEHLAITDQGTERFLINLGKNTQWVSFEDHLPLSEFNSGVEQEAFLYKSFLMDWVEDVYLDWLKEEERGQTFRF